MIEKFNILVNMIDSHLTLFHIVAFFCFSSYFLFFRSILPHSRELFHLILYFCFLSFFTFILSAISFSAPFVYYIFFISLTNSTFSGFLFISFINHSNFFISVFDKFILTSPGAILFVCTMFGVGLQNFGNFLTIFYMLERNFVID